MSIYPRIILLLFASVVCVPAAAQVYKCKSANGQLEYSSTPCGALSEPVQVIRTDPAMSSSSSYRGTTSGGNSYDRQLRALISSALASGDYRKAEGLAVSEDHWGMIRSAQAAEREAKRQLAEERRANRPRRCTSRGTSFKITDQITSHNGTVYCN
ncbi:MAG: DUF4124 domain-containing protein [Azoarcus sp. PHD]|nr:MAG: DUF4124 domain-containing protein [Azoarcus sp. PHD]